MRVVSVLVLLLLLFSCKKTRLKDEWSFLPGEWKWEYRIRQLYWYGPPPLYSIDSAANTYDYSLVFKKKGILETWRNGKKENRFKLVGETASYPNFSFLLNNDPKQYFFFSFHGAGGKKYIITKYFPDGINVPAPEDALYYGVVKYCVFRKVE